MATATKRREDTRAEQKNTPTPIAFLTTLRERTDDQVEAAESAESNANDATEASWINDSGRDQSALAADLRLATLRLIPENLSDVALLLDEMFDLADKIDRDNPNFTKAEGAALIIAIENCSAFVGQMFPELQQSEHFAYSHGLAMQRMKRRSLTKTVDAETAS